MTQLSNTANAARRAVVDSVSAAPTGAKTAKAGARDSARPPSDTINTIVDKLRTIIAGDSTKASGSDRQVSMTSIAKGEGGAVEIGLRSGGGNAKVSLAGDKATFTLSTPAFLRDEPGISTQNVLTYDIDLTAPADLREAKLIDDLSMALEQAEPESLLPPERALLSTAKEAIERPSVLLPQTQMIAKETIGRLIKDILSEATVSEIKDCKCGFQAALPPPVPKTYGAREPAPLSAFWAPSKPDA